MSWKPPYTYHKPQCYYSYHKSAVNLMTWSTSVSSTEITQFSVVTRCHERHFPTGNPVVKHHNFPKGRYYVSVFPPFSHGFHPFSHGFPQGKTRPPQGFQVVPPGYWCCMRPSVRWGWRPARPTPPRARRDVKSCLELEWLIPHL